MGATSRDRALLHLASSLEQEVSEQTPPHARLPRVGLGRGAEPRQRAPSPSRPRLSREGLGRGTFSVSREASFFVSLEAGSSAVRRPPPRPTLPTARHVTLILSTTPVISAGQRLNVTERPTRPEVASAPYRPGQGTAGITGHCVQTL